VEVWPAIDLRHGKPVRLQQGDYDRQTIFGDCPATMAKRWVDAGAKRLHLVDLDAARGDDPAANRKAVEAILAAVDVPCQLGGGVRDDASRIVREISVRYLLRGTRPSGASHKRYRTLISRSLLSGTSEIKISAMSRTNSSSLARLHLVCESAKVISESSIVMVLECELLKWMKQSLHNDELQGSLPTPGGYDAVVEM
jgi:imidazole glycerol phosphate synthase subunit HisF